MEFRTLVESAAVVTGFITVYLTVRQRIWCWPTGIVNALLFAIVFAEARLYGSMALQGVYVALSVYGWWHWGGQRRGGGEPLVVNWTPPRWRVGLGAAGLAGALLAGWGLGTQTDAALPFADASTTSFSLVAQFLLARKWVETWLIWITVDVVYVGLYASQDLYLTALLYAVFLVLAAAGWREWRRSMGSGTGGAGSDSPVGRVRAGTTEPIAPPSVGTPGVAG